MSGAREAGARLFEVRGAKGPIGANLIPPPIGALIIGCYKAGPLVGDIGCIMAG